MRRLFLLMTLFASSLLAADIAGTWKASVETPNGNFETVFVLKVDGSKLSGTVTGGPMGERTITEGKVDGDNLMFSITGSSPNGEFKLNYKGTVTGDDMKLEVSFNGRDQTFPLTAKRSK